MANTLAGRLPRTLSGPDGDYNPPQQDSLVQQRPSSAADGTSLPPETQYIEQQTLNTESQALRDELETHGNKDVVLAVNDIDDGDDSGYVENVAGMAQQMANNDDDEEEE